MTTSKTQGGTLNRRIATWVARVAVLAVFVINVRCALQFLFSPQDFISYYELSGVAGTVALQGLGVAFLMWNVTYPAVIASPLRFNALYIVVLIQQAVGFIGESFLYVGIESGHSILTAGILRFMVFDGVGFMVMLAAFIWLRLSLRREKRLYENKIQD